MEIALCMLNLLSLNWQMLLLLDGAVAFIIALYLTAVAESRAAVAVWADVVAESRAVIAEAPAVIADSQVCYLYMSRCALLSSAAVFSESDATVAVQAAAHNCILVTRGEEKGQCNVILCDSIGTPIDSNTMMVEPLCLAMTSTHVIAASNDTVFVWLYNPAAGVYLQGKLDCPYKISQSLALNIVRLSVLKDVCQAVLVSICA